MSTKNSKSLRKTWSSAGIRELARAKMKMREEAEQKASKKSYRGLLSHLGPDSETRRPAPSGDEFESSDSEFYVPQSEDAHRFEWGQFQQAVGERVFVVVPGTRLDEEDDRAAEIAQLCRTLGLEVVETKILSRGKKPVPGTYLGSGFLEELASRLRALGCVALVIDAALSPVQVRNMEKILQAPVVDREGVILAIFQRHARSGLAKMQVELAHLKYLQPRLTGLWSGLSRQSGGSGGLGGRGLGETRLELDRRIVKDRISALSKKLKIAEKSLAVQSARRSGLPRVALVGYTNAGKSTLMQRLTGADVEARNSLFSTLDTTVRALVPPTEPRILVSDTVGFVRDLPHGLVASFKSTLFEALESRLILHVLDASHPQWYSQFETTEAVLKEIGLGETKRILVINKRDKIPTQRSRLRLVEIQREAQQFENYGARVAVSALHGEGIDVLREEIMRECGADLPIWSQTPRSENHD